MHTTDPMRLAYGNQAKWDLRFMRVALEVASWSKDRSRHIGCVVVSERRRVRVTGYNGFPEGVDDEIEERHQRPEKYWWSEHAERNAFNDAASEGISLRGCTLYVLLHPCADCARGIIQVGIKRVVTTMPDYDDPKYGAEFKAASKMLKEAGVEVWIVPHMEAPKQQDTNPK